MYPNMMMFNPYMMNPMMMQPTTIKIEISPNVQPKVSVEPQNDKKAEEKQPSVYDMPKATVYTDKKEAKAPVATAMSAQALVKPQVAEDKVVDVAPKAEVKEAKADTENKKVVNKKPEIVKPDTMKTGIDLNGLVEILASPDFDEQADAMEAISEVAMYAPERAGELLDSKVVDTLLGIMSKDTTKMNADDKALAERNKEYAMFTTATLQKLFADGVKDVANVDVPTKDLIGMAGIVNELKTNSNPSVREAAVASIGYMTKPEHQKDLAPLLQEAANDQDAKVREQAHKQLEALK